MKTSVHKFQERHDKPFFCHNRRVKKDQEGNMKGEMRPIFFDGHKKRKRLSSMRGRTDGQMSDRLKGKKAKRMTQNEGSERSLITKHRHPFQLCFLSILQSDSAHTTML